MNEITSNETCHKDSKYKFVSQITWWTVMQICIPYISFDYTRLNANFRVNYKTTESNLLSDPAIF